MDAAEIVAQAHYKFLGGSTDVRRHPGESILDALGASGYQVVELPEPDSTRYDGDEHAPVDRPAWDGGGRFWVSHWKYPEVQVTYDGEPFEPISIGVARSLAAALLAAANAAEGS